MNDSVINVTRSSMPSYEEYCEAIKPIFESRWLTNAGPIHNEFSANAKKYLGVDNLSLFTNGHLALYIAIRALGISGEVITTPFTFSSTTHAIVDCHLTPVFCDVSPDDYTIDVEKIEALITDKTSAIIPVHVYGNVCNVEKIDAIAKKYNLKVIYDAAHAFGVKIGTKGIGNYGDISMFSFHATKVFNTIEGGCLTYRDKALEGQFSMLRNFGITSPESVNATGTNAKMNEFQAAMGICNLRHIDEEIGRRKLVVERYVERLSDKKGITLIAPQKNVTQNYSYFPVFFDGYQYNRNEVQQILAKENIFARKYFYPLTNELECYAEQYGHYSEKTPVAKWAAEHVLTLPLYADLTIEEVDRICDVILK